MKKTLIGGIAAAAVVIGTAGGVTAFALASGQTEPAAPPAPTSTISAEPTASATAEPTAEATAPAASDYPNADEEAFLAMVERDWQGDDRPADDRALDAGYEMCDALKIARVFDDGRFTEWSGQDNFVMHFAAEYHLCPAQ